MTDLNNCQYVYTSPDSITVYGPLANFISCTTGIYARTITVIFNDKSKSDGIHNIVKWTWDYGDYINHDYYSSQTFSHTYPDTGYFTPQINCYRQLWLHRYYTQNQIMCMYRILLLHF